MANAPREDSRTAAGLRSFALLLFVAGVVGISAELLLLDHYEGLEQWIPIVLMALSLVILRARRVQGGSGLRLFQATMVLFVLSGGVGTWLHYQGNAEFEKEMYPSLSWVELFWQSLTGATPALAPGAMVELGLLGLAYTYRHPKLG